MMRLSLFILAVVGCVSLPVHAGVRVRGYVTKSGKYVAPYNRTSPDRYKFNNWSAQGNINPYSGKSGSKNPWKK